MEIGQLIYTEFMNYYFKISDLHGNRQANLSDFNGNRQANLSDFHGNRSANLYRIHALLR